MADYSAIGDYAVIGDGRSAALVSRQGSVDWLCLPQFSSPAIFNAILDVRQGGYFRIRPAPDYFTTRRYMERSGVLVTRFSTPEGVVQVIDLMPVTEDEDRLQPQRELLRIIDGIEGTVPMEVGFAPRPDYARLRPVLRRRGALGWSCSFHDQLLNLLSEIPLDGVDGHTLQGEFVARAGERRCMSLTYTRQDIGVFPPLGAEAGARLDATLDWWRRWAGCVSYDGPYREQVTRSLLTLKMLTSALSGAVVAAPTTSLPERIGGVRNWDYRFCWLRDASLTLRAFLDMGFRAEGEAFLSWLLHTTRLTWPRVQVLYDIYGESRLTERELEHLDGYRASRPVRVGNAAEGQFQLDVYGELVLAVYAYVQRGGRLDPTERRMLAGLGRSVCRQWREPDHGIWEERSDPAHHTFSKLMCWVALDRLLILHEQGHVRLPAETLRRERAALREAIDSEGYRADLHSFVTRFGGDEVDASLLMFARSGYLEAGDPRMRGTFARIQRELGEGPLIWRFRGGVDGLPPGEGAFGIASFWAVDYLARRGDVAQARQRFESLLEYGNDVGLFAEEIDPESGELLGNFPQAFTHIGLIDAALALGEAGRHGRCTG